MAIESSETLARNRSGESGRESIERKGENGGGDREGFGIKALAVSF